MIKVMLLCSRGHHPYTIPPVQQTERPQETYTQQCAKRTDEGSGPSSSVSALHKAPTSSLHREGYLSNHLSQALPCSRTYNWNPICRGRWLKEVLLCLSLFSFTFCLCMLYVYPDAHDVCMHIDVCVCARVGWGLENNFGCWSSPSILFLRQKLCCFLLHDAPLQPPLLVFPSFIKTKKNSFILTYFLTYLSFFLYKTCLYK